MVVDSNTTLDLRVIQSKISKSTCQYNVHGNKQLQLRAAPQKISTAQVDSTTALKSGHTGLP